ncbi:hypothetical protein ACPEIF_12725 [Streptomyces sp. NPDC012600]|uniref:Uncharacterized protein n=1 Tax=Streptomyces stephensoniae TaxID=3375367 RepID=A0ABU2VTP4_9ACTN|nr:hypothetical protein [Streptomyces griseus]MDT0488912.1 hypothetical protein [Streptomyces griseus]
MNQCTSVMAMTAPDRIVALYAAVGQMKFGHVLCELGEDHNNDHAAMLWDEGGRPGGAVWTQWDDRGVRIAALAWCPALTPKEEACGLFADHPSAHAWDVIDPTKEALSRELAKHYRHLFPEYNEDDED